MASTARKLKASTSRLRCYAGNVGLLAPLRAKGPRLARLVDRIAPGTPFWTKSRRRMRFLRWTLAVQLLKGAAYAGGGILLSRYFGG
ncbi:hypothetical protein GTY67_11010 [Streptomyces sp. SID8374]|uniref:hypothetical protein n=1 Tax=Streptomyces sp. SID8374 TaxID=2690354 RepID=UPI00136A2929|nr:hypothetical protein [Streptomyces sp. SID8374]MYX13940.1 hypothetical protein [Streptomyces sp. SID8374]